MKNNSTLKTWLFDLLLLTLLLGGTYALLLGSHPLMVPDEARYAEIPREMIALGDYITPHLNYLKYFEKPPFFYWMQVIAIKLGGYNEWALRFMTAFMAVLGCLKTYAVGRRIYNRTTGWLSAVILGTSLLYFAMGHLITLDMTVSVWLTGTMFAFILSTQTTHPQTRRLLCWGMYICAAFAVLTKGLIGIVLPGMVIGLWILLFNQWRLLKDLHLISGLVLFCLIALPWHILVQLENPEFFHFYFIDQHFLRYATLSAGRFKPFWWFIPILLVGFFPWTVFLFQAVKQQLSHSLTEMKKHPATMFLLLWAVVILVFYSFSKSKLIPYILPIFPPLAIITGQYLAQYWQRPAVSRGIWIGFICLPVIAGILSVILFIIPARLTTPENAEMAGWFLHSAAISLIIGTLFSCIALYFYRLKGGFTVLCASIVIFLTICFASLPYTDSRSAKPLIDALQPILQPQDEVVSYGEYYQDLAAYLKRRITVVNGFGELTFGTQRQNASDWMINSDVFWQRWKSNKPMFIIISRDRYQELTPQQQSSIYILQQTPRYILGSNSNFK